MRTVELVCACACIAAFCEAKPWDVQNLPSPKLNPSACGQSAASSICDPDGLLQDPQRLGAALNALEADYDYPGCGGFEMGIVVVREISGGTEADAERFAKGVMDAWGVGKAKCNNGIVLAVAVDDRKMHIATGKGAAEYIKDIELTEVIERMKPLMRSQSYDDAAEQCISDVARILSGESFAPSLIQQHGFLICVVGLVIFCYGRSYYQTRRYNRCKRALTRIERERAEAKAAQYQVKSCAICLESFSDTPRMETRLLACGHTFHSQCVDSWDGSRGTCPICRQPTDTVVPEISSRCHRVASAQASHHDYNEEYQFRIRRARTLYPDYVSQSMVDTWAAPGYSGPVVADTAFVRASPNYGRPSSGPSGGDSSSFGGGCSSDGGGAGGSW
eukprot:TRINITY_DN2945_c2_g1_i1.p1 TRINITY_DN2945_c2_g1~~TRINITY_DN2945_c2_g1_i1.p1  ORF type:complete len:408 (+),score=34.10 TRINITY_DN2945_c2_g1_i1:55-1224(+)